MGVCIAVMFLVVVLTAIALRPPVAELACGLFCLTIPAVKGGVSWTIALMGGVGGTLTVLIGALLFFVLSGWLVIRPLLW